MTKRFLTMPALIAIDACASSGMGEGLASERIADNVVPAATSIVTPADNDVRPLNALVMVTVGYSRSRRAWRDIVSVMPLFNIFRPF